MKLFAFINQNVHKMIKVNEPTLGDIVVSVCPSNSEGNTVLLETATVLIDAPRQSQLAKCLLDAGVGVLLNAVLFEKISLGLKSTSCGNRSNDIWLCNSQKSNGKEGQGNLKKFKNKSNCGCGVIGNNDCMLLKNTNGR